ncbi:MAG: hypothetical protein DME21_04930 [Verrucomicrobia bacterium]|nr:MAG: hypothetical protein DME21_04930 [Verrucomicrobiota bacterium]
MKSRFLVLALVLAQFEITAWGAEDPRRFLAVTAWEGHITTKLTSSGSAPNVDWSVDRSVVFDLELIQAVGFTQPILVWGGAGQVPPNQFQIQDRVTLTLDPNNPLITTISGAQFSSLGPTNAAGSLVVDLTKNTYTVGFGATYMGDGMINGTAVAIPCLEPPFIPASTTFPLPETGLVISNKYLYSASNVCDIAVRCGDDCILTYTGVGGATAVPGTVEITWNLVPKVEEVELAVEINGYKDWIPAADLKNTKNEYEGRTPLNITTRLQTTSGEVPATKAEKFRFELTQVSKERGVCLNFPPEGKGDTKPDLRFNPQRNPTLLVLNGGKAAETKLPDLTMATAALSAYDFGGYGNLKVTATVHGKEIVGYLKSDPAKPKDILLPKRTEPSKIADAWKDQHQVRSLADTDDSDNIPVGDTHKGDGYSLYEEYRGFVENQKHIRTNPDVKDLFVRDQIGGADVKEQIIKFGRASQLDVHHKLRRGEMAADARMNFNHDYAYLHDQHGIYLRGRTQQKGLSEAVTRPGFDTNTISTPATYSRIDLDPNGAAVPGQSRKFSVESVAHELGHVCAVYHHGDSDPPLPLVLVKVLNPDGASVFQNAINGSTVLLKPEDSILVLHYTTVRSNQFLVLTVGERQGQHSGNMDCIMRYHAAEVYPWEGDPQHVFYKFNPDDQHSRTLFCESAAGTKANAPAPGKPWPRFGDADTAHKRDGCKRQICVNDFYFDDELHKRY